MLISVSGKGNALGVNVLVDINTNWVQPLRSFGIAEFEKGGVMTKTPKFDFILSTEG